MTEPKSVSAWSLWHPEHEWGIPIPRLWPSKELAINALKVTGLWPLQHGWQLLRVTIVPSSPAPASQHETQP